VEGQTQGEALLSGDPFYELGWGATTKTEKRRGGEIKRCVGEPRRRKKQKTRND